jgi:hypothetical protein
MTLEQPPSGGRFPCAAPLEDLADFAHSTDIVKPSQVQMVGLEQFERSGPHGAPARKSKIIPVNTVPGSSKLTLLSEYAEVI